MIMHEFKESIPKFHRDDYPIYSHYSMYRTILKDDFDNRCAYCHDTEKYSIRSFAIDHFVPQKPKYFIPSIKPNDYNNLIYSCSYCNRAKWDKWPTNIESEPNNGLIGFVKPTEKRYTKLFYRNLKGRIIPNTGVDFALAKHIKDELLLWHPIHSLMWKIEKLMDLEEKVDSKLKEIHNDDLSKMHSQITKQITDVFREIFK